MKLEEVDVGEQFKSCLSILIANKIELKPRTAVEKSKFFSSSKRSDQSS
jgi:hypothetical protein